MYLRPVKLAFPALIFALGLAVTAIAQERSPAAVSLNASESDASRHLAGQLADLPIALEPEAEISVTLVTEGAELVLHLSGNTGNQTVRVPIDDDRPAALETAALRARAWLRDELAHRPPSGVRGSTSSSSSTSDSDSDSDSAPEIGTEPLPPNWSFHVGVGWMASLDGTLPMGPLLRTAYRRGIVVIGLRGGGGFPVRVDLDGTEIRRHRFDAALEFGFETPVRPHLELGARSWVGLALETRKTERTPLAPTSASILPFLTLGIGGRLVVLAHPVRIVLALGAEVWPIRPEYRVEGGATLVPWALQPRTELALEFEL